MVLFLHQAQAAIPPLEEERLLPLLSLGRVPGCHRWTLRGTQNTGVTQATGCTSPVRFAIHFSAIKSLLKFVLFSVWHKRRVSLTFLTQKIPFLFIFFFIKTDSKVIRYFRVPNYPSRLSTVTISGPWSSFVIGYFLKLTSSLDTKNKNLVSNPGASRVSGGSQVRCGGAWVTLYNVSLRSCPETCQRTDKYIRSTITNRAFDAISSRHVDSTRDKATGN